MVPSHKKPARQLALPGIDLPEHAELIATVNQVMPFGRFIGTKLIDLPEPYLVWFHGQGFPGGLLGRRMALMYEVKINGLEALLRPLGSEPGRESAHQSGSGVL